jgi:hypothetical protein
LKAVDSSATPVATIGADGGNTAVTPPAGLKAIDGGGDDCVVELPSRREVASALKNGSEAESLAETSADGEEGRGEN